MTLLTALEIFTNPSDLCFVLMHDDANDKWGIIVSRGPGHNYKPLLSSQMCIETKEKAIEGIIDVLNTIREESAKQLQGGPLKAYLNPSDGTIDQSKVLNQELCDRIIAELREKNQADTSQMFAAAQP